MKSSQLTIGNVNVFDSAEGRITGPMNVAIQDGLIRSVEPAGSIELADEAQIDGTGQTLMPGLIDAHWHAVLADISLEAFEFGEIDYVFARAVTSMEKTMLRGFTTVRDVGGPVFGTALF